MFREREEALLLKSLCVCVSVRERERDERVLGKPGSLFSIFSQVVYIFSSLHVLKKVHGYQNNIYLNVEFMLGLSGTRCIVEAE